MTDIQKFQMLLRELFQFDCQDLDFGIYRVLNYKRKEIEEFIDTRLPKLVDEAFTQYAAANRKDLERELEAKRKEVEETAAKLGQKAFDEAGQLVAGVRETPLGKQFIELAQRAKAGRVADELKASVYNDLYTFFSRYYEDGDIFSKPRRGKVEIPFTGHEDVVLHWANKDQYYIKTGEQFRSYRFKVDKAAVQFALQDVSTEQNNNRGEKRYFVLAEESSVAFDDKTKTLTVSFEYRPLTNAEKKTYGKTENQKPQDKLNAVAEETILKRVKHATLKGWLAQPFGEDKPSLLLHNLTRFTKKNSTDFFIHKDLRGFLRRELEDFLKTEVLRVDEILGGNPSDLDRHIRRGQVMRTVAGHIIDFLSQVEDFQKRLFEKRKFVVRTEYCITLDRLPEYLWGEVLNNEPQLAEWRELYAITKKKPDKAFLKEHKSLVVDTRYFSENFKWRLLSSVEDMDAALDGLLIKSENFQALALLAAKYRERVKCIYIDPPYNTGSDEFIYKDNYQHSSWLSMMADRCVLAREFLRLDGAFFSHIDDNEVFRLQQVLNGVFGSDNFLCAMPWIKRYGPPPDTKRIGYVHEMLLAYRRSENFQRHLLPLTVEQKARYKNPDNDSRGPWKLMDYTCRYTADERPNLDYPVINPNTGKKVSPKRSRVWAFSEEEHKRNVREKRIWWGADGRNGVPALKNFLSDIQQGMMPSSVLHYEDVGHTDEAAKELRALFPVLKTTSKPTRLTRYLGLISTDPDSIILDCFGGSGTTGHGVINLNREDNGRRKYILVEVGNWFGTVMLPRIKKVVFCASWKDGKPAGGKCVSHFLKYQVLEQYEDTLINLELVRVKDAELALKNFGDEYLLRYMLEFETQGSASLLAIEQLRHPFAYRLRVQDGDEIAERTVDLVETFNYLLGLKVKRLREYRDDKRLYRATLGEQGDGKSVVVIWRDLDGLEDKKEALQKDRQFIEAEILPALLGKDNMADRLVVNGSCAVTGAEAIEPEFKRLMFGPIG